MFFPARAKTSLISVRSFASHEDGSFFPGKVVFFVLRLEELFIAPFSCLFCSKFAFFEDFFFFSHIFFFLVSIQLTGLPDLFPLSGIYA